MMDGVFGRSGARAVAWIGGIIALIAVLVAIKAGRSPWFEMALAVVGTLLVWQTFRKLTSEVPTVDDWDGHVRFFLLGLVLALIGLGAALTGGDDGTVVNRVAGGAFSAAGILLLAAEWRDFRLWRAQVREERQREARRSPSDPPW